MVELSVGDSSVIFRVEGLDKLWAFKGHLEIPLVHIRRVRVDPEAARGWWHGLRVVGTNLPGVLTAGTFYQHGKRVFWDVHDPERTIVVELVDERYDELVVEVAEPKAAASLLRSKMG